MTVPTFFTSYQGVSNKEISKHITVLRLGLVCAGVMLIHLVFVILSSAPVSQSLGNILLLIATGLSGLLLLISDGLWHPPTCFRWLILIACLGGLGVRSFVWIQTAKPPDFVVTDSALYTEMAGNLLRYGENPYTWDLSGSTDLYNDVSIAITPRLNAASESIYPYPALPFLLAIPFQLVNLPAMLLVSILSHALLLVLLFIFSPQPIQPLILIPIVMMDFISITLMGSMDIVWAALLVGMVVAWRRPTLRAILYGLAASFKQGPWLIAPFLLIRIWRDRESHAPFISLGRFLLISGVTFLLINLPFIAWNPASWLHGVMEPLHDNLVFLSHGALSSLSQLGFARLPKNYYLIATLSVLGLLLFAYWRHYDVLEHAFWIMPGIFMWFSYRSLASYWIYWVFPILATLATQPELIQAFSDEDDKPIAERSGQKNSPPEEFTTAVAAVTLGALFLIGVFFSFSSAAIEVIPFFPLPTANGRITRMSVEVINHGRRVFSPRFAIQSRQTGENPLPWYIERGPRRLSPGQSATYHIATAEHRASFLAQDAAQLVVTDAEGKYAFRDVSLIGPDRSFLWPDAIPNPTYAYWNESQTSPIFWNLTIEPPGAGTVSMGEKEGRGALTFTLDPTHKGPNKIMLQNSITFPREPFGIWVYSDSYSDSVSSQHLSSVAWGLEIDDGQHRLRYLFGSQDYVPFSPEDGDKEEQYIITQIATPGAWSCQEIDVLAAYHEAGWALPELRPTTYRGLDTDLRMVGLSLFLIADDYEDQIQVYFGSIEQDNYGIAPQVLMAETFNDPGGHYLRLAESYFQGRNYTKAWEAYQRARQFSSDVLNPSDELAPMIRRNSEQSSQ